MIKCGNCHNFHESIADIKACSEGKSVKTIAGDQRRSYKADMNKLVSVNCVRRSCRAKSELIPVSEAMGWACAEHNTKASQTFELGDRVLYNDKRFEILELLEGNKIRLRTGGNGKIVTIDDIAPIPA